MTTSEIYVLCSLCREDIPEALFGTGAVADLPIFKAGELSYIELAHAKCARNDLTREWEFE
jgi:hypothetical protein